MKATGLNPNYFYLLDPAQYEAAAGRISCVDVEVDAPAVTASYQCRCHKETLLDTSAGACGDLLGALLGIAHSNLPIGQVVVTVTRYAKRASDRYRPDSLALEDAERIALTELFGSTAQAQALVEEAWRTIHWGNAEAVLELPE